MYIMEVTCICKILFNNLENIEKMLKSFIMLAFDMVLSQFFFKAEYHPFFYL